MAIQSLSNSNIPSNYSKYLYDNRKFDVSAEQTSMVLDILVNGATTILKNAKTQSNPVAVVFNGMNSEFIAAAIVQYFEGEDGQPGNWNYSWTFDEEDIKLDNIFLIDVYDPQYLSCYESYGHTKYCMLFKEARFAGDVFTILLSIIKNYLNENASESEEIGVSMDGVIQFRVVVEDGEKVLSIEPDGEIKQLIKDDAAIEK